MEQDIARDDWVLLDRYVAGDAAAFEPLVRGHIDLVYSSARRMLGGGGAEAEDVAQAVFLLLAQRAGRLKRRGALAGWLYRATVYCCRNVRKAEGRRRRREREAAAMRETTVDVTKDGEAGAVLDEGLRRLGEKERAAVVVRYLEGKRAAEAGRALGVSADAAEKRAERGLAKLRRFFAGRGFVVPAAGGVAGMVMAEGAKGAPVGLAGRVAGGLAGGLAGGGRAAAIAKGAGQMMRWAKVKAAAAGCVAAGVVVGVGLVVFAQATRGRDGSIVIGAPAPAGRRAMMVRWDVVTNEAGARRVMAAVKGVETKSVGYGAYVGDAARVRAAVMEGGGQDVLLTSTFGGWARMDDGVRRSSGSDFRLQTQRAAGSVRLDKGKNVGGTGTVMTDTSGPVKASAVKGAVRLEIVPEAREVTALFNDGLPEVKKAVTMAYSGEVPVGSAVVFAGEVAQKAGVTLWHVSVWEAFSASDAEFAYLRRMQGREVVERGVNDALADADQALAWNAGGKKDPDDVGAAWERRLSGGAVVRLVGVARPGEWKDCWWDAEGKPVAWDPRWDTGGVQEVRSPAEVAVAVSVEDASVKDARGLRGYGSAGRGLAAGVVSGDAVEVGVGDGAWTEAGRVQVGETVEAGGVAVKVLKPLEGAHRNGSSPGVTVVKWEAASVPEVEVWVVAYDKAGKAVADGRPAQILVGKGGLDGKVQEMQATEEMGADEIGGYAVRWRKRAWVRFEKFATMPVEVPGAAGGAGSQRALEVVKADTPEGFMAAFQEAALSGDGGKVRGMMVLGEGQGAQAEQYASLMAEDFASAGALWSAAVKKFGEEETGTALGNVLRLPQVTPAEGLAWEVRGDRARLVNNGRGNVVMVNGGAEGLVRVRGAWRVEVVLPQASATAPGGAEAFAQRLERFAARQKEVTARRRAVAGEVAAGKYKDAYGVRDALNGK